MHRSSRSHPMSLLISGAAFLALAPAAAGVTSVKPYVVPVGAEYDVTPLLSVADQVPETTNPSLRYHMVGIPDGLDVLPDPEGGGTVFMNHEFTQSTLSEPVVGGPRNRGAIVSSYAVDADGDVVSGERAYDTVYQDATLIGPAADEANSTPGFGRFCSSSLAYREAGFDRPIYFANEEVDGTDSFDGLGGQTVAIFDNEAHALSGLGHFSKENSLVMPRTGQRTVILPLEDGPSTPDSQLYLYVGKKDPGAGTPLARNGLTGGTLYVFRSTVPGTNSEGTFTGGTITGEWVEVPDAATMSGASLEAAVDALGAFGFVRIEDGAFAEQHRNEFFFVTTGGNAGAGNELGRLYHLRLDPSGDPTKPAELRIVYNADQVIADGRDIAISPDNLDVNGEFLMINEDGTSQSRSVMAAKGRDGSIWRFELNGGSWLSRVDVGSAVRVAELDPPGRDGVGVGPGVWETSGIVETSALFGPGTWVTDVQAHAPTTAPSPNTVEDGQLLLLKPVS